ncbi:hypothetical protein Tco_0011882, partial [Tanacetum coccineum]
MILTPANASLCQAVVLSKDVHELFGAGMEETSVLESRIWTDYYMAQVPAPFYESDGSKRVQVYKFLRSQGFVSSHDTAHHYTDTDAHKLLRLAVISLNDLDKETLCICIVAGASNKDAVDVDVEQE